MVFFIYVFKRATKKIRQRVLTTQAQFVGTHAGRCALRFEPRFRSWFKIFLGRRHRRADAGR